jgi:hypothetical protein
MIIRSITLAFLTVILCFKVSLADERKLSFDATNGKFSGNIVLVKRGDKIELSILGAGPLDTWSIETEYKGSPFENAQGALAAIDSLVAALRTLSPLVTADEGEPDLSTKGGTRVWIEKLTQSSARLWEAIRRIGQAALDGQENAIAQMKKELAELNQHLKVLSEQVALDTSNFTGPPFIYKGIPGQIAEDEWLELAGKLEQARLLAVRASGDATVVVQLLDAAIKSRTLSITVEGGSDVLHVSLCRQRISITEKIALGPKECSWSFELGVMNPWGPAYASAGLMLPIFTTKPVSYSVASDGTLVKSTDDASTGSLTPMLFFGLRLIDESPRRMQGGLELGLAPSRLSELATVGAQVGIYGISIGGGVFFDRKGTKEEIAGSVGDDVSTRTQDAWLTGAYVKISMSRDFWEYINTKSKAVGVSK